ncbi:MAG: hypothetical protein K2K74_13710 [Lachnospiraceae bacterium]|nr:hypothetical protein [Lachnospiraceae bacterium]
MDFMNELIDCLNNIDYDSFDEDSLNELLDCRDSAPFDTEWCRVDEEISRLKNDQNYTAGNEKEQEKIRQKAFLIIEQNTESELADYVSDDFGLIYDSFVLHYRDEWLDQLIEEYKNGKIPAGVL